MVISIDCFSAADVLLTGSFTYMTVDMNKKGYFFTDWLLTMLYFGIAPLAIVMIPVTIIITLMFLGWTFDKDIFKIDSDKYDQVEINF